MNFIEGYEGWLKTEKGASENTLTSYLRDVRQFAAWMEGNRLTLTQTTQSDVNCYADCLRAKGRSEATVARMAASLKSFYGYMVSVGCLELNPVQDYTYAKQVRKPPQLLSGREVELFLAQPDASEPKGCRDKAMLELLYAAGIRVSELVALDAGDVDLTAGLVRCGGRGKTRTIPLNRPAVRALTAYMSRVRPKLLDRPEEPALFVNLSGERLTRQGFWKIFKLYQERAHIEKDITPHSLRCNQGAADFAITS